MTNKTCVMDSRQLIYRKKKFNGMFSVAVIAYLKIHYSHFPFRMFSIECDFSCLLIRMISIFCYQR